MWLKILTLLSLCCLWPIVGLAQLPKDPLAQETLRGLPGVRLIVEKIDAEVERDGLTTDLAQYERVKKVALLENELTIESGELTPTLKVKRRVVDEKYRDAIDRLYGESGAERS